jgi:hypothetical protein
MLSDYHKDMNADTFEVWEWPSSLCIRFKNCRNTSLSCAVVSPKCIAMLSSAWTMHRVIRDDFIMFRQRVTTTSRWSNSVVSIASNFQKIARQRHWV